MFIFVTRSRQTASLTHRFCKAEETLCFPSDHVWRAWKNRNKGMVGRCGLRGRRDWTVISSHEVRKLGRNSAPDQDWAGNNPVNNGDEIFKPTFLFQFWRHISISYSQLNIKNQTNNRAVRLQIYSFTHKNHNNNNRKSDCYHRGCKFLKVWAGSGPSLCFLHTGSPTLRPPPPERS